MSLFQVVDPVDAPIFQGSASLSAIAEAARETALLVDNLNASDNALAEAITDGIAVVRRETGLELRHPQSHPGDYSDGRAIAQSGEHFSESWDRKIADILELHPDKAEALLPLRLEGIEQSARDKARAAGRRSEILSGTRDDWAGLGAALYGGFTGALQDPATLITLPLGFGSGAARTFAGKILTTAWREALLSGGSEAAVQPFVQSWRAEAGLPSGFQEGLKNVGMATALGGILGGGLRGAVETPGAIRRAFSRRDVEALTEDLELRPPERIAEELAPHRDDLQPATRAAVDVMDQDRAVLQAVREELGDDLGADFAKVMEAAEDLADQAGTPGMQRYQPEAAPRRTVTRPTTLTEFLARNGLAPDPSGNLKAMDLDKVVVPGHGRLVRKDGGVDLDRAREAAAEAGYFPQYGRNSDAVANSTIDDLLDALKEEQAGNRQFAFEDQAQARLWQEEGDAIEAHKEAEALRREIFDLSGGNLSRAEMARAQRLVEGGMDPDEAVERVFLYDDTSVLETRPSDPFEVSGSAFDEQMAAMEAQLKPDDLIMDLLSVDEDGAVSAAGRTLGEALNEADRGLDLANLVEACKLG